MDATTIQGILDAALGQGIWCALFIYFFWYMQKENEKREEKLLDIIKEQSEILKECTNTLKTVEEDVKSTKTEIQNIKIDIEVMKNTHSYNGGEHHEN